VPVVEIESRTAHGDFGRFGFLDNRDRAGIFIQLDHAIAPGIAHAIGKEGRAAIDLRGCLNLLRKAVTVENIVAQNQRAAPAGNEIASNEKGLRNPLWFGCTAYEILKPQRLPSPRRSR